MLTGVPRRSHHTIPPCPALSLPIVAAAIAVGCASKPPPLVSPPLAKPLTNKETLQSFYPNIAIYLRETGHVIVEMRIVPSRELYGRPWIDFRQTSAPPTLIEAALNIFNQPWLRFDVGSADKRWVRASVVFEVAPCGALTHAEGVDYRLNLCATPRCHEPPSSESPLKGAAQCRSISGMGR